MCQIIFRNVKTSSQSLYRHWLFDLPDLLCGGPWENVTDGEYVGAPVVKDGNLISGKGLGHIFDFALTLSTRLPGDDAPVRDHAKHIYYRG